MHANSNTRRKRRDGTAGRIRRVSSAEAGFDRIGARIWPSSGSRPCVLRPLGYREVLRLRVFRIPNEAAGSDESDAAHSDEFRMQTLRLTPRKSPPLAKGRVGWGRCLSGVL